MAEPIQDENGVWHCNPPQYYLIPGQGHVEITTPNGWEIDDMCNPYKTTEGGNAMPIQDKQTYEQKKGLGKRKVANRMRRNKKLSASGCSSCGSNFTGDSKPCSCGRNPGGSCQCKNNTWQEPRGMGTNWGGSSAQAGGNASQPISMPIMAGANGLQPGQRLAFPHNQAIKKYDMLKFSNFVSKIKSNGRKNFVNPINYGAAEDEIFAYNPRVVKDFSTNRRGFLDKSDLNNYSF